MITNTADPAPAGPASERADRLRHLWLLLGAVLSLFAVNGSWGIPVTAWFFSVFLLRFSRTSRPLAGIGLVWLVSVGTVLFWMWRVAVPLTGLVVLGGLAFGTVLALPYLVDRLLAPRLGMIAGLLPFPAALTAAEFLLGRFGPFGTAYGLLADTQQANTALLQVISVTGPYSIGFLIGAFATAVNAVWQHPRAKRAARALAVYAAVLAVVIAGGSVRLAFFPASSGTVRIAGINPSLAALDAEMKALGLSGFAPTAVPRFDPDTVPVASSAVIDGLFGNTRRAARAGAKIVVWSENAARISAAGEPSFLSAAQALARQEHIYLLVADNVHTADPALDRDETHLITPDGGIAWTYEKAHPIPGLESYTPGDAKVPVIDTPYGRIANVICYDADFPDMMHVDAGIMLVPGGDWPEFGRAHTEMSSLRAIENGYALVRQDFSGWSAGFDHQGRTLSTQETTVDHDSWILDVPTRGTTTAYRLFGDIFAWLCLAGTIVLIGYTILARRTDTGARPRR